MKRLEREREQRSNLSRREDDFAPPIKYFVRGRTPDAGVGDSQEGGGAPEEELA